MYQPLDSLEDRPSIIDYAEVDVELDSLDVEAVATQEPHFLDYDSMPPSEFEEQFERSLKISQHIGEEIKMEKKYERDGEVSDYELAASGYTKKEFTQDDNTLHFTSLTVNNGVELSCNNSASNAKNSKVKHFLDENPIPPDYLIAQELREHRSLDRNFGRQNEQQKEQRSMSQSKASPTSSLNERHSSLYSKFTAGGGSGGSSSHALQHRIPRGAAWTERLEDYSGKMQMSTVSNADMDVTLGSKVECVYSLLSMLGSKDPLEMAKKFFELSENSETCITLRRSGCIPLLVQMIHSADNEDSVRKFAGMALHNVVHRHPDEKAGRREAKVMRLLDQIMDYCHFLKSLLQSGGEAIADDSDRHPLAAISSLMKVSFDEEHRHAMCELGALQAIPNLVHLDHAVHGPRPEDQCCNSLRRYALMALTNLTFGDENNKALLCSQKLFMEALIAQLDAAPDDLLQVTASVLRNLSWRADNNMKAVLNEIGTVTALARAAMSNKNENTLKAILSALWNLSAHCSTNKAEFCAVDGALAFLVKMLTYEGPSKTLKIIENAGGILRNVSSHIAVCEAYRQILREHNCLSILLQQLKSESLTVVSNSCGTLWNLSARCPEDQKFLWDNGAIPMLRSLIHSKHAMISEGSSSALKNLLNFRPAIQNQNRMDPIARSLGLKKLPTLNARKQKALQQELGENTHSETSDILDDIHTPSTNKEQHGPGTNADILSRAYPFVGNTDPLYTTVEKASKSQEPTSSANNARISRSATLAKSESRDSIFSSKSDSEYENIKRSHFATDANRNSDAKNDSHMPRVAATAAFELESDVEIVEEQPIDYSVKYNEDSNLVKELDDADAETGAEGNENYPTYQETDLDQPTDFSLRYAENQTESDIDILPTARPIPDNNKLSSTNGKLKQDNGNEMLLILEDSVKCYQTEDTPYIISNAASITDLRQAAKVDGVPTVENKPAAEEGAMSSKKPQKSVQYGSYTPEKPINYCEEGTPGYFSRYDSLSSLDEASPADKHKTEGIIAVKNDFFKVKEETKENKIHKADAMVQPTSNANSALETPLMFSRRSSMDSLVNEDVGPCDDKSSVVSDFSRLASGVISPSELPDSPTQSMPQTPRRNSVGALLNQPSTGQQRNNVISNRNVEIRKPLHSVFEDDLSTFNVENTPAQFSTATSLSNLSIVDDEHVLATSGNVSSVKPTLTQNLLPQNAISEGEEDESNLNNDDILLASCINIGMNRATEHNNKSTVGDHQTIPVNGNNTNSQQLVDEAKHYCTEDTPALLSKVGSNTNLSLLSMDGSRNDLKEDTIFDLGNTRVSNHNLYTRNLSDDVSSNASECGAIGTSSDILQQCILDGMKKTNSSSKVSAADPIGMMRRGGNLLPQYLPVSDEMNKYLVEDSPCNFSVVSDLSNLTVGSSLVGPAVQLKSNLSVDNSGTLSNRKDDGKTLPTQVSRVTDVITKEDVRREHNFPDDSLSSLSIDSEDDTNLLSQAIAAGCNRPKSNLGFNSATSINKKAHSISSSQPIPIIAASSTSSLTSAISARNYKKQQQMQGKQRGHIGSNLGNNESYSSVDSSDSNDNQSKSLFELCILSGMYKTKDETKAHKTHSRHGIGASSTQSNPNLKQFDSLPMPLTQQKSYTTNHHHQRHHHHRERELKDEKLLLECINTGISKKISRSSADTPELRSEPIGFNQNNMQPKNVQATSAAALDQCHPVAHTTLPNVSSTAAAPDVERNTLGNYHSSSHKHNINNAQATHEDNINVSRNLQATISQAEKTIFQVKTNENQPNVESNQKMAMNIIGFKPDDDDSSDMSNQSFLMDTTTNLYVELQQATSANLSDKQKDPDLMLKSVERLTLEFVTSAEQLRTQVSDNVQPIDKRLCAILAEESGTNSNNTWNEHTCPNDVSFPSVSVTAPVLASLSVDDEADDEQATEADCKNFTDLGTGNAVNVELPILNTTQPNSLETETDTLVNELTTTESYNSSKAHASNGINFELGGQVQSAAAGAVTSINQLYFNGTSGSIMSNSTMIAFEARALSDNLKQVNDDNTDLTFSINSLDLDNVRPPSGMESLNISSCFNDYQSTQPNSIQYSATGKVHLSTKSPKFPRKSLPAGLLARRALGQLAGSAESVNSSYNLLDNIKPPSLMDELLDSMVSVASIQSEVADCENNTSIASTFSLSNYETAAGANTFDDNTITLASCFENMPCDDGEVDDDATFNDFSSAGSTPKKASPSPGGSRRTLTPKQKRIMDKDRYRTYTISSPLTLSAEQQKVCDEDDTLQIEIIERSEITSNCDQTLMIIEGIEQKQISNEDIAKINSHFNANFNDSENMVAATDSDELDVHQSSETESCNGRDDYKITQQNISVGNDPNENVESPQKARVIQPCTTSAEQQKTAKVVRGRKKTAYISPYSYQHQSSASKVTTRLASKDQSSSVVATRATTRKTTITSTKTPSKAIQNKKVAEVQPTGTSNNVSAAKTLPRQGTFIKDEPTNVTTQVPVVPITPTSATTSPSHRASKLPTKRALPISTTSPKRNITNTSRKTPAFTATTSNNATVRKTSAKSTPQRSNTNIRLPSTVVAKQRTPVPTKAISRTTPPSRSNSTLNANNDNMANINQAQNRIANIWKRVGDAKTKQLPRPTATNVKAQKSAGTAKTLNTTTEPKTTLIRSSTFDNGPKGGAEKSNLPIVGC